MRPITLAYLLPLIMVLPACSSSDPLSNLKGTYELATGCNVKVTKSEASASCDTSSLKAEVKISISDTEVKIVKLTWTTKESNTTCFSERVCTTTYTGSTTLKGSGSSGGDAMAPLASDGFTMPLADQGTGVTPDKGATTQQDAGGGGTKSSKDGLFSGLAGDWTGSIKAALACEKETLASGASKACKTTTAETITYSFDATVKDHTVKVSWYGDPKAGKGDFTIYETKNGVRAADKFFKRTTGGGSSAKLDKGAASTGDGS